MFRTADMVMLSKADLLPVLDDFSPQRAEKYLRNLASSAPLIHTSAKSGNGMDEWLTWLHEAIEKNRLALAAAPATQANHHHHQDSDHHHDAGHSELTQP
jgi:hydrogenase nickel incorporation protein HypB